MDIGQRPQFPKRDPQRVAVPSRGTKPAIQPLSIQQPSTDQTDMPSYLADLPSTRERLGFDDIPVSDGTETDSSSFRDIFGTWVKQIFRHDPNAEKTKKLQNFVKDRPFKGWRDDLKWALKADMDDGEPIKPRPAAKAPPAQTPRATHIEPVVELTRLPVQNSTSEQSKTIEININMSSLPKLPSLSKIRSKVPARKLPHISKKLALIGASVAVITIVGTGSYYQFVPHPEISAPHAGGGNNTATKADATPQYTTILPGGKSISDLGGWARVSPPESNPVYAYADKIDDVVINVSQQPLPKEFKANVETSVGDLAKSYAATDEFKADSTTIYVGTSSKGPQSVIFSKNDLLILIKSTSKIDDKSWADYAKSLK